MPNRKSCSMRLVWSRDDISIGTSGYNYPEWKGSFYPEKSRRGEDAAVLRGAVSDRRDQLHVLPDAEREAGRRAGPTGTPSPYKLTLKAPRRITHDRRLQRLRRAGRRRSARRPRRSATSSARCCFSCRRTCKKDLARASTRSSPSCRRGYARGVRVPPRVVARRRGVRRGCGAQPRAVRRRQREAVDAGR